MGTGAEWVVPAVISALSTGAGVYTAREQAKEQDQIAARGIAGQQAKQRQIDERLQQEIGALEGSSPEAERQASMDAFMQQLRATSANARGESTPGVSRTAGDTQAAQAAVGNYGTRVADILSRVSAPGNQRRREGFGFNRAASDVAGTAREASGNDFLTRLRMGNVQQNPWVNAAGEIGQGVAQGMASRGPADPMAGLSEVDITAQRIPTQLLPRRTYNFTDRTRPFGG